MSLVRILRNTTAAPIELQTLGITLIPSMNMIIDPADFEDLVAADSLLELVPLINDGSVIVNDGVSDLDSVSGLAHVLGSFNRTDFVEDRLSSAGRFKVDVAGTLENGLVFVSDNDQMQDFLQNKIEAEQPLNIFIDDEGGEEVLTVQLVTSAINISDLNNDSGFVDSAGAALAAPVQSVNGLTGSVNITPAIIGAATAMQGLLADSALQPGDNISELVNDSNFIAGNEVPNFETNTTFQIIGNTLRYTNEDGVNFDVDLTPFLDDTNLARLVSGVLDPATGIATFSRDDGSTFTVDFSGLVSDSETRIINQPNHGFSLTNNIPLPAYVTPTGQVALAQADSLNTLTAFVITEIIDANSFRIRQSGFVTAVGHGLALGNYYFLDENTAGAITITEPLATINDVVLFVVDASTLMITDNRPEDKNSLEKFIIKTRNTDTSTELNDDDDPVEVPLTGTISINENNFYTVVGNGIQVPQNRSYFVKTSIHIESDDDRTNQLIRFAINGVPTGDIAATGYIRDLGSHSESSFHLEEVFVLNAGDIITVISEREANDGDVNLAQVGSSSLTIEAR